MADTTTLLIIDDESSVRRALSRVLSTRADTILTAATITDALLIMETNNISHVICDHLLGPGQPTGIEAAVNWKKQFPTIQNLLILTGSRAFLAVPPEGIDAVIPKTTDPMVIADKLNL
ncbi:MAG: hypothetical protein JXR91_05520 [Deltaproteobacteria bacterium]|nr:hypothetical protein [Deltaproteobacteria bacterium]